MKFLAFLFCLFAVSLAQTQPKAGHYCEPANSDWCIDWFFGVNNDLQVKITANTVPGQANWVGFGLNNEFQMIGSDAVVAWVQPNANTQTVACKSLTGQDPTLVIPFIGGNYAVANNTGVQNSNGVTIVRYSRPLTLFNKVNIVTVQNNFQTAVWAIGPSAPTTQDGNLQMHVKRGLFAVNFYSGQTMANLPPTGDASRYTVGVLSFFACLLLLL